MTGERNQQPTDTPAPAGADGDADNGLDDLRARLDELHDHVELLGSQGVWPEPQPAPPAAGAEPAVTTGTTQQQQPLEPAAPPPPPPQPPADPAAARQPDEFEQQPPPPVATNGHSKDPAEVSARSTSVALVDAGPFEDLVELRHFEDDLASLAAVRDVRVRRFGQGRASIEVGLTGPYALSRELYRLGREMSVHDGATGDLVIDFAPTPEEPAEEAEAEQDGGGEEPPTDGGGEPPRP